MSDITAVAEGSRNSPLSITVTTGSGDAIERAKGMLAGIDKGFRNALGSALRRTVTSTKAYAAQKIRSEYYISSGEFKRSTISRSKITTGNGSAELGIEFIGRHIPLLKFDTNINKSGRVTTRVKKSSGRAVLEHAFFATMPTGHSGIFERETEAREPIRELFGPSTPQMMSYNDEVREAIAEHQEQTFAERLDHEVAAILNGWRG